MQYKEAILSVETDLGKRSKLLGMHDENLIQYNQYHVYIDEQNKKLLRKIYSDDELVNRIVDKLGVDRFEEFNLFIHHEYENYLFMSITGNIIETPERFLYK